MTLCSALTVCAEHHPPQASHRDLDLLSLQSAKGLQEKSEAVLEAEREAEELRNRVEKLTREKETTQTAFKELQSRFNALNDEIVAVEEEKAKQLRAMRESSRAGTFVFPNS